jgi:predicted transcriptional regulator of viral defense system
MKEERRKHIEMLFQQYGPVLRTTTLRVHHVSSRDIRQLLDEGLLIKHKTGYYAWSANDDLQSDMALASRLIPNAIVCLYSAAVIFDLTNVNPIVVHLAVSSDTVRPVLPSYPPIKIHVFSSRFFGLGDMRAEASENQVRVYNRERTVCDFFRLRNQLGEDIALEVLKNYMAGKDKNLQQLFEYAEYLRIKTVIKPYVEAML